MQPRKFWLITIQLKAPKVSLRRIPANSEGLRTEGWTVSNKLGKGGATGWQRRASQGTCRLIRPNVKTINARHNYSGRVQNTKGVT